MTPCPETPNVETAKSVRVSTLARSIAHNENVVEIKNVNKRVTVVNFFGFIGGVL